MDPVAVKWLHLSVIENAEGAGTSGMPAAGEEATQPKAANTEEKKSSECTTREKKAAVAFSFSDSFPPIPVKLIVKIQKGDFVDMPELLRDNIEAERCRGQGEGASGTNSSSSSGSSSNKPPRW